MGKAFFILFNVDTVLFGLGLIQLVLVEFRNIGVSTGTEEVGLKHLSTVMNASLLFLASIAAHFILG